MAKAKKLPSGAWRVQVYSHTEIVNGKEKRIYKSFTNPIKEAAELEAAQFSAARKLQIQYEKNHPKPKSEALGDAIDKYIEMNRGILDASTISGYEKIRRNDFQELMQADIYKLTQEDMQLAISKETQRITRRRKPISPKTIRNAYGLISSVLSSKGIIFKVHLPKVPERIIELPAPQIVFSAIKDTSIELPCLIACWLSFSMSEIRGIHCSSIRGGHLYMEHTVIRIKGEDIEKETGKAEKRIRKHRIPKYIMELIKVQETYQNYLKTGEDCYLISLTYGQIYNRFREICKENGFKMTFHQLRHLNASIMLMLNVPEKYAMERGGWKTPHTMKRVYQHTFNSEREKVDNIIDGFFETIISDS